VFVKIRLELLFGFVTVEQKFLSGPESQPANVAVCNAGSRADEPYDLKIPFWHGSIVSNPAAEATQLHAGGQSCEVDEDS
jgi:hypothetical protein